MPSGLRFARSASPLEIGSGLLLLGVLTLVFSPFYAYGLAAGGVAFGAKRLAKDRSTGPGD